MAKPGNKQAQASGSVVADPSMAYLTAPSKRAWPHSIANTVANAWYNKAKWLCLLLPFSLLFAGVSLLRRRLLVLGGVSRWKSPVPVIVVGNITVGGTGKTPLVVALVKELQKQGYNPGVISRGYGSKAPHYPFSVSHHSSAEYCGDEPLLIACQTQLPVVIDADRTAAARYLLEHFECDVIVSDDGLQHYALQRDIEIVVVDGERGFGNQWLLPAGPLRESLRRLASVDFIVSNGVFAGSLPSLNCHIMTLQPQQLSNVFTGEEQTIAALAGTQPVHAIAGIGNPGRFYSLLRTLGVTPLEHSFLDHHQYTLDDLQFGDDRPLLTTEKDAVKIRSIEGVNPNCWYLPVVASFESDLMRQIIDKVKLLSPTT